jgi:uroporphyrinogen decarboxylase
MADSKAAIKTARVLAALDRREGDRVPIGEFFWTSFVRRAKAEKGLSAFDPYRHWDLDMVVLNPNMDPRIEGIRVLEENSSRKVVRTGFGATIELRPDCPMPLFREFATESWEAIEALRLDDPLDDRRYRSALDDQINSVGDALNLGLPPFVERVDAYAGDFCLFGGVCEPHEMVWRIIGSENSLLKMAEDPARYARLIERLGDFAAGIVRGQAAAARGKLKGVVIWGDIAYCRGMFFSPRYWREVYKPQLAKICAAARECGLRTLYHGCGNASAVFDDLIEAGVEAYNPLEAKAGLDVVELKRRYGRRWAFCGNIDVRVLSSNDREKIRREVLRKMNAAKGGGYIVQSDHSIPGDVASASYDLVVDLVREHGKYPLRLGKFDEPV